MRRANKQTDSCKHLCLKRIACKRSRVKLADLRHKTWTNPRPTFKVLAGNLNVENRKTPTIPVGVTIIIYICSFHLQVSERFE